MGMLHSELRLALESRLLTEPRINGQIGLWYLWCIVS